jgi:hypothetical protein
MMPPAAAAEEHHLASFFTDLCALNACRWTGLRLPTGVVRRVLWLFKKRLQSSRFGVSVVPLRIGRVGAGTSHIDRLTNCPLKPDRGSDAGDCANN